MKKGFLPVLFLLLMGAHGRAATDVAPPKKGVTVAPPLSADVPSAYADLPSFGSIIWETRRLPWVDEGPYAGISGVAMAPHGGKIYVVGGFLPGGDETDDRSSRRTSRWTWVYDPAKGAWERLADAPNRREYTRGIVAGDALYLIGGGQQYKDQDPAYRVHGDCAVFDLSLDPPSWRAHSILSVPRTHTAVGSVDDILIVAGGNEYDASENGYSHRTIRDTTEVFDLSQPARGWEQRASIPTSGRGWSASVIANKHLYLFGGLTWSEAGAPLGVRATLRYDPKTNDWQKMTPPPLAMSGWEGALYADRYAILAGGVMRPEGTPAGGIIWSDLAWVYDSHRDHWFRVNGILPPGAVFNDPGVVILGNTIYVLGAEGPSGSHYNYFLIGRIQPDNGVGGAHR